MMDYHANHGMFVRRSFVRERNPAARWVRVWVPQEVTAAGKRIYLLKWVREDMLKVLKEKFKEPESEEPKPEPTTEILFLCNYEGCYKASPNEGQHRKHAHIHSERQFVCSFPGCGKAFNLDFNLRAHMKIHSQEHYHVCPYPYCSKIYTQECKLKRHIKAHHEKNTTVDMTKHTPPAEKFNSTLKSPAVIYTSPFCVRPYVCPYDGCGKNYIHEYKLNLHLKNQHPGHNPEDDVRRGPALDSTMDEVSDQDVYIAKGGVAKNSKRNKPNLPHKMPPARLAHPRGAPLTPASISAIKLQWPNQEIHEGDSEETEEERENVAWDSWRYREVNGDDEETEDEQ